MQKPNPHDLLVLDTHVWIWLMTGAGHSVVIARVVGGDARKEFDPVETLSLPQLGWSYAG